MVEEERVSEGARAGSQEVGSAMAAHGHGKSAGAKRESERFWKSPPRLFAALRAFRGSFVLRVLLRLACRCIKDAL